MSIAIVFTLKWHEIWGIFSCSTACAAFFSLLRRIHLNAVRRIYSRLIYYIKRWKCLMCGCFVAYANAIRDEIFFRMLGTSLLNSFFITLRAVCLYQCKTTQKIQFLLKGLILTFLPLWSQIWKGKMAKRYFPNYQTIKSKDVRGWPFTCKCFA